MNYKVIQIKDKNGVINLQNWMQGNHPGWFKGKNPVDGIYGPQTKKAFETYQNDYFKRKYGTFTPPKPETYDTETNPNLTIDPAKTA